MAQSHVAVLKGEKKKVKDARKRMLRGTAPKTKKGKC